MSDNLNRDFSKYEAMETEELEKILQLDAEALFLVGGLFAGAGNLAVEHIA